MRINTLIYTSFVGLTYFLCCSVLASAQSNANSYGDEANCENDTEYCNNRSRLGKLASDHRSDDLCYVYADSIYNEAVKRNDQKGRVIAISHKALRHISFSHIPDSMKIWNDSVKSFAKNHRLPRYYYFMWSQYIAALLSSDLSKYEAKRELDRMLDEATSDHYVVGQIECYRRLADFYNFFSMTEKAYQMRLKEIQLTELYDKNNYNLGVYYAETARDCLALNKYDEAEYYLNKGDKCSNTEISGIQLLKTRVDMAVKRKDAKRVLELAPLARSFNSASVNHYRQQIEIYYHIFSGNFFTADSISEILYRNQYISEYTHLSNKLTIAENDRSDVYLRDNLESILRYRFVVDSISHIKLKIMADQSEDKLNLAVLESERDSIKDHASSLMMHLLIIICLSVIGAVVTLAYFYRRLQRNNLKLKASERALLEEKEVAVKASEMKAEIIRNMSHEIRTPLNAVVGFSEVLSSHFQYGVSEESDLANKIQQSANELLAIVNTTIELSDLETIVKIEKNDKLYINEFCASLLEKYQTSKNPNVSIRFYPLDEDILIRTNERYLRIGIDAILNNAFKFTSKGYVELSIYYHLNKGFNIEVVDTGCGIPDEMMDRLFDQFFKIDQFAKGIGLGLTTCQLALSKINASISISPLKNQQGTCASIKFSDACITKA